MVNILRQQISQSNSLFGCSRDTMEQSPYELEEAAAIDRLTGFQTYRRIIMPLAIPALTTAFLLVFISWTEFTLTLTFMNRESSRTLLTAGGVKQ
jgi:ABC-type glycerol-3-phosphate transport system permease component